MMNLFDTFLIGRKTFDAMRRMGNESTSFKGITNIVLSRTLRQEDYPRVRIESDAEQLVTELRKQRVYEKTGTIGLEYDILRE